MSEQRPPTPEHLLAEFPVPDLDRWRAEVARLLKGAPLADLATRTPEGVIVAPMATAADTADLPWLDALPGQAPYQRGAAAAGHRAEPWLVAQELPLPTVAAFNEALAADLVRGQTAVHLVLDAAGRHGLDPDLAPAGTVGAGGTSVVDLTDLATALAEVDLAATPLLLRAGASGLPAAALVAAHAAQSGAGAARLRGLVGGDPVAQLAVEGALPRSLARIRDEQAALVRWAEAHAPELRTLPIEEDPWHDGGADGALSLGLVLAAAVGTLRDLEARGVDPAAAAARLQFHLAVGSDFFLEIARIRALRLLWSRVQEAAGLAPLPALIHARTSRRTQTRHDPHVNMLRATTQALSAVLGGVQSLHVAPFDEVDSLPDEFGRRIARNVQLLLLHEVGCDRVADPAGGSWHVERLTADMADAAWSRFQEIERDGGIVAGLRSGAVQQRIAAIAAERRVRLATGRDVLVGTNRYADPAEPARAPRRADPDELARQRAAELAARRPAAPELAPLRNDPARSLTADPVAFADALAVAAVAGATLGDLAGILRDGDAPDAPVAPVAARRDAAPFEDLRARVAALRAADGRRGRIACACVGSLARTLPRLDFARGFLQVGGFEVLSGDFHADAAAAVRAAQEGDAAAVLIVGLDEVYAEHGSALVRALKAGTAPPLVLLAGRPRNLEDELRAAGVDAFIQAGGDVLEILGRLIAQLEVTS